MKNLLRIVFSFPTLTLLVALTLSAIAAWYSILGLTAIFAAAVIPIIIMGASLEVAKVVTTIWLHRYWHKCGTLLKVYLVPAVLTLAFITSMGIFGFLSKSHNDQNLVSGDTTAQIEIFEEKITVARENIETNRRALAQLDAQVDQMLSRTDNASGINRSTQIRRQQAPERQRLLAEISEYQNSITELNQEVAPLKAKFREVEAEVGPIRYIAAMIYGDNPDSNLLEKAVRWVIILIVCVFDPLALMLVIASQKSYMWLHEDLRRKDEAEADEKFREAFKDTKLDNESSEALTEIYQPIESLNDEYGDTEEVEEALAQALANEEHNNEQNNFEPDDMVGEDVFEAPIQSPDEDDDVLDTRKAEDEASQKQPEPKIITENVTYLETGENYVNYNGKSSSKQALAELRPDLFLNQRNIVNDFGFMFPPFAKKGQIFTRVDIIPNRQYQFDGYKWVEISKDQDYEFNQEYIKYLIDQIDAGKYDVALLTDKEKIQIEDYLKNTQ